MGGGQFIGIRNEACLFNAAIDVWTDMSGNVEPERAVSDKFVPGRAAFKRFMPAKFALTGDAPGAKRSVKFCNGRWLLR